MNQLPPKLLHWSFSIHDWIFHLYILDNQQKTFAFTYSCSNFVLNWQITNNFGFQILKSILATINIKHFNCHVHLTTMLLNWWIQNFIYELMYFKLLPFDQTNIYNKTFDQINTHNKTFGQTNTHNKTSQLLYGEFHVPTLFCIDK